MYIFRMRASGCINKSISCTYRVPIDRSQRNFAQPAKIYLGHLGHSSVNHSWILRLGPIIRSHYIVESSHSAPIDMGLAKKRPMLCPARPPRRLLPAEQVTRARSATAPCGAPPPPTAPTRTRRQMLLLENAWCASATATIAGSTWRRATPNRQCALSETVKL